MRVIMLCFIFVTSAAIVACSGPLDDAASTSQGANGENSLEDCNCDPVESVAEIPEEPEWEKAKDIDGNYSYDGFRGILVRVSNKVDLPGPGANPIPPIYLVEEHKKNAFGLINLMAKCESDSQTFKNVLIEVAYQSREYGQPLRIIVVRGSQATGALGGVFGDELDTFIVDLDDLEIFPNPVKSESTGMFESLPGHPVWAEYLCSVLGHELAEFAARRKNYLAAKAAGKEYDLATDRSNHHYQVANSISDKISKDYFDSDRVRGEDCSRVHTDSVTGATGDHTDILVEIKGGQAVIIHRSPSIVEFEQVLEERYAQIFNRHQDFKIEGRTNPSRWSHITYEENFKFPAVAKTGAQKCVD